jgi:hypothetical protein
MLCLTELPFGLPGKLYRSPMPFDSYDSEGIIFQAYKSHNVSVVVVLAEDDECLQKAKRDLCAFYKQEALDVIHSPIRDFSVPSLTDLQTGLDLTISHAKDGRSVASLFRRDRAHRLVRCALASRALLALNEEEAIQWVRRYIEGAVEMPEHAYL